MLLEELGKQVLKILLDALTPNQENQILLKVVLNQLN